MLMCRCCFVRQSRSLAPDTFERNEERQGGVKRDERNGDVRSWDVVGVDFGVGLPVPA
jgi:hypothetical protein